MRSAGETDGLHLEQQAVGAATQKPASADKNVRLTLRPREDVRGDRGQSWLPPVSPASRATATPQSKTTTQLLFPPDMVG